MSKEIKHYEEMCRVLKRQLETTHPDDNADLYASYKQRLTEFQQLLFKARRRVGPAKSNDEPDEEICCE